MGIDVRMLPLVLLFLFIPHPPRKIKIWLIGDSTMADKEVKAYPETGWGMPFAHFFDSTVTVDNRAKNGRSTRSFIAEGLWQPVVDHLQPGDYVFIQFGHNDEGKEKTGRYTTPEEFKTNLDRYIAETRGRGAIPVLLTPVARRRFAADGSIRETHPVYADAVRAVAAKNKVAFIDLDEKSKALLQQWGPEHSTALFNYLQPGEHPNYPEGHKDDTHFNELGARKMAELVLQGINDLHLDLAGHIRTPLIKGIATAPPIFGPQRMLTVAADGSGDYSTVQAALDAVPLDNTRAITLYIKKGIYHEKLHLDSTKNFVTLLGEDEWSTILTYDDHSGKRSPAGDTINTRTSYTFLVRADDLTARHISFRNDAGVAAGQAVALEVQGDRAAIEDCRLTGNQDVLFLNSPQSRQYYKNCYIEGTTDFIFGAATAWFDHCHIHSKKDSYVTAASTPEDHPYGFVFNDCVLTGDSSIHKAWLGRPWRPWSCVTFMHCYIGAHIRPEGWSDWNNNGNYKTARYGEYHNEGPASGPAQRVSWAHQLTDSAAQHITLKNTFGDWQPGLNQIVL
jgi:pectinesterase